MFILTLEEILEMDKESTAEEVKDKYDRNIGKIQRNLQNHHRSIPHV